MKEYTKGEVIQLEITGLTSKGQGLGRHESMVIFVPHTAPGDVVEIQLVNIQKSHCFGVVQSILTPSPHRQDNDCPAYPDCGGCTLRHMSYSAECSAKEQQVVENLRRIGGIQLDLEPMIPSPIVSRYRNKAQFPIQQLGGKTRFGFYQARSHDLIPLEDCLLQPEVFSTIGRIFCEFMDRHQISSYEESRHRGLVRHLSLRITALGEVMVTVVINGKTLPQWEKLVEQLKADCSQVTTLTLSHNTGKTNVIFGNSETVLFGAGVLIDRLCGIELQISSRSFYQVNHPSAQLLYKKVKEYAAPHGGETLLDLYCGIGSIGLTMAGDVGELIGVELVKAAVEDAQGNAHRNGITNATFLAADAGKAATKLAKQGIRPDTIVVDPPRKGIDQPTVDALLAMAPQKIVYVSCNSATLARDAKLLVAGGYGVTKGCAVDLFPRTPHIESVLLLERS